MNAYTSDDLQRGAGAFEQAMRSQTDISGFAPSFTPGVGIGILSAAMRSKLPVKHLDTVIDRHFGDSALLLQRLRARYEGTDWDMDLWCPLPDGRFKLCTALCCPDLVGWRYQMPNREDDPPAN